MEGDRGNTTGTETPAPGWRTAGSILAGISHELNGRITALLGIVHVARSRNRLDGQLLDDLEAQVEKLKRCALLLRHLPWFAPREPQLVKLDDILRDAIQLHDMGARGRVSLVASGPGSRRPVRLAVAPFTEALLALLAETERICAGPITVAIRDADAGAAVVIEGRIPAGQAYRPESDLDAVTEGRQLIGSLGGRVLAVVEGNADGGIVRIEIILPRAEVPATSAGS
jgi:hypothetical protein